MNPFGSILVRDADGERNYERDAFPLEIGSGSECDFRLPGLQSGATLAYLGIEEDSLYVQPARKDIPLFRNERAVTDSTWLRDGDVLRIENVRIHCEITNLRVALRAEETTPKHSEERQRVVPPPLPSDKIESVAYTPRRVAAPPAPRRFQYVKWLAAAGFAVLVLCTAFLFTARSVRIDVIPAPDDLELEGFPTVQIGERHLMRAGAYVVRAEREGYAPLERQIEIGSEQNQDFAFELERLPGRLRIDTGPLTGATIRSGEEELGTTPAEILLPEGTHRITIAAPRYREHDEEVAIEGGDIVQRLDVELVPAWAEVRIASAPPGATLSVDGHDRGAVPSVVEIMEGNRELALRIPGRKVWRRTIAVEANQPIDLGEIALPLADATLEIETTPAGALVSVDGTYRGQTPVTLELTPGEEHQIALTRSGSVGRTRRIELASGQRETWKLSLPARTAEVRITTRPKDVAIFVDGRPRNLQNGRLKLSARRHTVEARKSGFEPARTEVLPLPGFPIEIALALAREGQAAPAPEAAAPGPTTPPMVRIEPGHFTMGASRRERGRRANEALREVEFTRPFYLSKNEVTNREFHRFDPKHQSGSVGQSRLDGPDQPVVNLTWNQAAAYCNWLSQREGLPEVYEKQGERFVAKNPIPVGYRLPTEAEWEWAARAAGRSVPVRFAWGMSLPPAPNSGNYADASSSGVAPEPLHLYKDGHAVSAPVGTFPPSPLGIHDMGGNVAEWTHDLYAIGPAPSGSISKDPTGAPLGRHHVIRGSSWRDSSITRLRLSFRDYGDRVRPDLGFRIARYAD